MDKRKVIDAYGRGLISLKECAQILGIENTEFLAYLGSKKMIYELKQRKNTVRW